MTPYKERITVRRGLMKQGPLHADVRNTRCSSQGFWQSMRRFPGGRLCGGPLLRELGSP